MFVFHPQVLTQLHHIVSSLVHVVGIITSFGSSPTAPRAASPSARGISRRSARS